MRAPGPASRRIAPAAVLVAVLAAGAAADSPTGVRARVEALAAQAGIVVSGLDRLGDEAAPTAESGDVGSRLRALLDAYNHVIVDGDDGVPQRVWITSRRQPAAPARSHAIPIAPSGEHHTVEAILVGPNGQRLRTTLLVDTGASDVVLPAGLGSRLGFGPGSLRHGRVRTANGDAEARLGRLERVEVGTAVARDVPVTFIDESRLGDTRLLGMGFLGRYRVTIDEDLGRLLLIER